MLFANKGAGVEYLVAGLGNPGPKYDATRHNTGFLALDYLARKAGVSVTRARFSALTATAELAGKKVLLMKPQTFMNLSGDSLGPAAAFYKIPPERCIVLCDDVSLPAGTLRVRLQGSAGGHNGLKSIIARLGDRFPRVKIGVGTPPAYMDMADYVLGRHTDADRKAIEARLQDAADAVEDLVKGDAPGAMSRYNGPGKPTA